MVLKQFGEYFFEFCKRSGYDHMLRTLGGSLFEFIENLDALHSYLSLSYKVQCVFIYMLNGGMGVGWWAACPALCFIPVCGFV